MTGFDILILPANLNIYLERESKQPNGCFSLRWTQYITAKREWMWADNSLTL